MTRTCSLSSVGSSLMWHSLNDVGPQLLHSHRPSVPPPSARLCSSSSLELDPISKRQSAADWCVVELARNQAVTPIIADLSIGVSTPRIHLGTLRVNLECRYGLKKDFRFGAVTFWRRLWETELRAPLLLLSWLKLGQPEVETRLNLLDEVSNSASTANQDVVATQLAAMQQQFGVFQLVLAQLLARNNPGDPLINLLNPAPQPPAPPQNPDPVQHAPTVSESQGQSHIAPVMQPPRDDVTRRLDSLEKLVVEQQGVPPPHPAADSVPHPLNTNIILEPYPTGFRIPQLETYDGTKDPDDHLHAFYSCMQAQNASDALMCKIFSSTLRGNARTWYYNLPLRSINSYIELASAFATKFSSRRLIRKTTFELMRVKQRDGESLKNFMSRFNDAVLEVNSFDQAVGITAVISGLGHERFRDSLLKHPATTFSEVNDRSLKFIIAEEYALSQNITPVKNQHPDWRDEYPNRKRMKTPQNRGLMSTSTLRLGRPDFAPSQQPAGKPPGNWTPFNLPRSQIFMQIKNKMDLRCPSPMRTAAATRDHTRYCDFHQDHGHTIEQCNSLRSELESLAQKGMLNEYIQRVEQPRFVREQGPQHQAIRNPPNRQGVGYQQAPPPLPPPTRVIHMITGGLEAGGLSSKQRKLYVREVKHQNRAQKRKFDDAEWKNQPITFTSTDLETVVTPHNDPLVTSVTINNCEVQRVLVDTGSAPDIMYFHCFESLGLDPALLQRYVTPSVRFLVVKMASSFNAVIGRPTLTEIRAVVSQSHLCMKFPTPTGIATLRGNQEIPDDQQVMGVEIVDNRPEDETKAAPVEDVEEVQIDDKDSSRKTQIGTKLNQGERAELIAFLRANKDVFAWTSADMPGIPTSVIKEEVEKLLQADFVRRVDYCEWVANPVLVKKANSKWRMCIDYTNLNDACPKDCYPMPNIDKLVKAASGNERLSLLDAYSGYHQVPMAPEDEEKTSFYAGDEIYCYVMMPFGLKNAGATYQKMVTIVFRAQIGRNLEVYVDDIVVKSLKVDDHLTDLEETFNNLRQNRMRLNPAKCIFGVESGKFLGFMVSRRGIEVNPEKIRAIAEMEPPKSVKDIQRLIGRVAALHRFISKSADKCLLFFKIMRSVAQNDESDEAISSVLVREEAKQQKPVYYISSVLHGAELRYPIAEKAALAVVTSARNTIQVYSDSQLVVNQINSICEVVDLVMVKYVALVVELKCKFQKFCLSKIPRTENEQADSLSKFASDSSSHSRSVFVEVIDEPSFVKPRVMEISTDPSTPSWTDPILSFLRDGIVPEDRHEAMKLRRKASRYTLVDGVLYALREVHEGICGSHVGARTLAHKVLRQGYYWPNMYKDATHFVQRCLKCQFFVHLTHQPAEELTTLVAPWPFAQWGLDLLGPFMKGVGGVTHLIVGVDYFTKWVEARSLSSLTSKKVEDFVLEGRGTNSTTSSPLVPSSATLLFFI
ncbi:hypothetical protein SLEP1_g10306 [Rubroshorea leprosula]|uniref:Reverse transcriptase n=1 Tax=Rubroshorea leprosula TaxID=152421 RepID=A0AAV5IG86_9ROSI|nr:hypothetical protein SLEP1_g10306 [Rubroshorea leprosula]